MGDIRLTDDEFFMMLRANAGLFSRTAKAIQEKYQMEYTRQAVYDRASKRPELLQDIRDENIDIAEAGINDLAVSDNDDIKFKACTFILKTLGKKRGYVERVENAVTDNDGNNIQPIININVIRTKKEIDDSL